MRKSIASFIGFMIGITMGSIGIFQCIEKKVIAKEKEIYKNKSYYDMTRKWVEAYQNNEKLETILINKGYRKVAIYGMGEIGFLMYNELKNSSVQIAYGIDKNAEGRWGDLTVVSPSEDMEEVDAIIVTALFAFDEISNMLNEMVCYPVVAMDDLIYEL